jgi:hypothetical protein
MPADIVNVVKMIHKTFNDHIEMESFIEGYKVSDIIICIDNIGIYHIWVDNLVTICKDCNKYTHIDSKYCAWCGNPLVTND